MNSDLIILIVQIIAALGVVISVVYLGVQIHQQWAFWLYRLRRCKIF